MTDACDSQAVKGRICRAAMALPVLLLTSGCSPEVTVRCSHTHGQGRLVALIAVCHGYLDDIFLYRSDTDNSDDDSNDRGQWEHDGQIKTDGTLTLAAPEASWAPTTNLRPLETDHRFTIYAWTKSSRWTAGGPGFKVADLGRLDPDHVLMLRSAAEEEESVGPIASTARFHDLACGRSRG